MRCAAAALVAVAVAVSGAQARTTHNPWTIPGTLRVGISFAPRTLNPILESSAIEVDLGRLVFDGLLMYANDGTLAPRLALEVPSQVNGGISNNGRTIRYRLRHGVKWQDGAPFTSHDVVFTWHAIMNPANNLVTRVGYEQIERIDTPDAYTVVLRMKRAFASTFTTIFGYPVILPAHLLEHLHDLNNVDFNRKPVGTGPFKVVAWDGDRIEYVANPGYYLGAPKLSRIVVRIASDDTALIKLFRSHDIDWLENAQTLTYRDLKGTPGSVALALDQSAWRTLIFNTTHPPLDSARMRRALAAAIDKVKLMSDIAAGTAQVATGDLSPVSRFYDATVRAQGYDPAFAKRELDAMGWRVASSGVRTSGGRRLALTLTFGAGGAEAEAVAREVAAMLRRVGVAVEIKGYNAALLFANRTGILAMGTFDLNVSSFVGRPDADDSRQLTCANRAPGGYNYARYCNPDMERAQAAALGTFDVTERKAAISTIQHVLERDNPQVYLWWPRELHIINSDLHGIDERGIPNNAPYEWSI